MPCPANARTRASREPTTIRDERREKDLSPKRQRPHPGKGEAVEIDEVLGVNDYPPDIIAPLRSQSGTASRDDGALPFEGITMTVIPLLCRGPSRDRDRCFTPP